MDNVTHKTEITTGGLSLTTILFLIFLVLKLTGYISWSWWWVTAPLWGGPALVIAICLLALVIAIVGLAITGLIALIKMLLSEKN